MISGVWWRAAELRRVRGFGRWGALELARVHGGASGAPRNRAECARLGSVPLWKSLECAERPVAACPRARTRRKTKAPPAPPACTRRDFAARPPPLRALGTFPKRHEPQRYALGTIPPRPRARPAQNRSNSTVRPQSPGLLASFCRTASGQKATGCPRKRPPLWKIARSYQKGYRPTFLNHCSSVMESRVP